MINVLRGVCDKNQTRVDAGYAIALSVVRGDCMHALHCFIPC